MNTFQIKIIALLAMTLDHIAYFFLGETPLALIFHWIGRISAPLFIFCVVNGMKYTRSKRKYILRLYLASAAMAVFQMLSQTELNFFRTLFIIAVLIAILEIREHAKKYLILFSVYQVSSCIICAIWAANSSADLEAFCFYLLPALSGSIFTLEGGLVYVLIGMIFYWFSGEKKRLSAAFAVYILAYTFSMATYMIPAILGKIQAYIPVVGDALSGILEYILEVFVGIDMPSTEGSMIFINYQWCMLFALPLILSYNQRQGRKVKYSFYLFYPLHIILFWLLSTAVLKC